MLKQIINVPKLRFREFEGEWVEKRYGNIYSFYSTNSLSRDKLNYEDGEVKNIHYGDIHTKFSTIFDIKKENVPFINRVVSLAKIKDTSYCKEGDLIIADASEDYTDIGKTIEIKNLNNQKLLAGLHTFLARPNSNKTALGFMGYLLQSWKIGKQVMTIAQGTKVLSLSTTRLKQVKLDLPQKEEQQKIATYLTSIDKKIEQLNQKRNLLESYKKGVMQKIFSQEIRFKRDDGGAFEDWEEKRLGKIGTLTSSKRVYLSDYVKIGVPFYRGKEISELKLGIIPKDILYISEEKYEEYKLKYGVPMVNDLLITAVGTLCNVLKITNNKPFYFKDGNLIWIKNIEENSSFLEILLHVYKRDIEKTSIGSTQRALTMVELRKIKLPFPQLEEQQKISNFLTSIDQKITQTNQALEEMKAFKKGLLQQMFV